MNQQYKLLRVTVKSVDYENGLVTLSPEGEDPNIKHIVTTYGEGGRGISLLTPYSSSRNINKEGQYSHFFKEDSMNFPSGYFYTPNVGDKLFIACIFIPQGGTIVQHPYTKIIILGFLDETYHFNSNDEIGIIHKSGAAIKLNHSWLDPNLTTVGETQLNKLNGHITIVANRYVTLSGTKFLPFGGLSHQYTAKNDLIKIKELGEVTSEKWATHFSKDIEKGIFSPTFDRSQVVSSAEMFLDPPCPEPGERMDMHDSGWKVLVNTDGNENKVVKSNIIMRGEYFNKYSFDPKNELTSVAAGAHDFLTSITDSDVVEISSQSSPPLFSMKRENVKFFGAEEKFIAGSTIIVDASLKGALETIETSEFDDADKKAETDKYKISVGTGANQVVALLNGVAGEIQFSVGTAATLTLKKDGTITMVSTAGFSWEGDFVVTGKVTATGDIKGANLEGAIVKATTQVTTPIVGSP